jgi:hypothetical protein
MLLAMLHDFERATMRWRDKFAVHVKAVGPDFAFSV